MSEQQQSSVRDSIGAWTKRCYFAGRAVMDSMLRPFDLGATQWYVLYHLSQSGPTRQRDLVDLLRIERATLSGIVATLLRKGLVKQVADGTDGRQKLLRLTAAGSKLWHELPDLAVIHKTAFAGTDPADIATTIRVLRTATERLEGFLAERS